jgi:integrase
MSRSARISAQTVASLKPGELLWDAELSRFGARRRTVSTTYVVKVRIGGRQRWITLGRHGPLTPTEARALARKRLAEIDSGLDPTRAREARRTMPTVATFAEQWLRDHVALKRKPVTLAHYQHFVRSRITPSLGQLPVDRVDRADIAQLHTELARNRYAANRVIAVLSAMMSYAERLGLRPQANNPCRGLERYAETKRKRPLTQGEIGRLWSYLDDPQCRETVFAVAAIRLLLLTGMRKREVLTLRRTDVDLDAGVIKLRDAKTGPRTVILSRVARELLAALPRCEGNPFVICGEREGRHLVNLFKTWHRIRTRLNFPEVRIHDLRHTVGTMLARLAPLVVVRDATKRS